MAITIVGSPHATSTSTTVASYTGGAIDAGTTSGDVIVLYTGNSSTANPTTSAAGYTEVPGSSLVSGSSRVTMLYKIAGASESAPTITHSSNAAGTCITITYRGVDIAEPWDTNPAAVGVGSGSGSATTVTLPNITTVTDQALLVAAFTSRVGTGTIPTLSSGANYTEDAEQATSAATSGANVTCSASHRTAGGVSVGTYGGDTFTSSVGARLALVHAALRPASNPQNYTQTVTDPLGVGERLLQQASMQFHDVAVLFSP